MVRVQIGTQILELHGARWFSRNTALKNLLNALTDARNVPAEYPDSEHWLASEVAEQLNGYVLDSPYPNEIPEGAIA
jgi:hypothetical protein